MVSLVSYATDIAKSTENASLLQRMLFEKNYDTAKELIKNGNYPSAILILEELSKNANINPELRIKSLYALGESFRMAGNIEKAIENYEKVVEDENLSLKAGCLGSAYLRLGYLKIRIGEYDLDDPNVKDSILYFTKYIENRDLKEYRDEALLRRGYIHLKSIINKDLSEEQQKERFQKANGDFEEIIKRHEKDQHDPFFLEAFFRKSTMYISMAEIPGLISGKVREDQMHALLYDKDKFPNFAEFLRKISEHSEKRFDQVSYEENLKTLIDALKLFLEHTKDETHINDLRAEVFVWVGNLYYKLDVFEDKCDFTKALKAADEALKLAPGYWRITVSAYTLKNDCYLNLRKYEEAIKEGTKAVIEIEKAKLIYIKLDITDKALVVYSKLVLAMSYSEEGKKENFEAAQTIFREIDTQYKKGFEKLKYKYRDDYIMALNGLWYARCLYFLGEKEKAKVLLIEIAQNKEYSDQRIVFYTATAMLSLIG